ncbi:hypothetical protein [Larkinella sp. C7]|uniref:hypothetical protein n=1 Tax=Larkinella sp. C7 TaxID=2576607 RepID=UPI001486F30A|nr:hypothetical protein [Larkinella sp. C7]
MRQAKLWDVHHQNAEQRKTTNDVDGWNAVGCGNGLDGDVAGDSEDKGTVGERASMKQNDRG